jgi:glycosyltransferase involved in cell wall biosynthesis
MKIAAICCTYLRSHLLGQMIRCFLAQDYPAEFRELIILDDAGEYRPMRGDGWQLVTVNRRFQSLGQKRNAATALASSDVHAYAVWDDDDLYLPGALRTCAEGFEKSQFLRPSRVLLEENGVLVPHETGGLYHGGWAYSRAAFEAVGGYRTINSGEDQDLAARLEAAGFPSIDPLGKNHPYYIYRNDTKSYHISWAGTGKEPWEHLGRMRHNGLKDKLDISWPYDLLAAPIAEKVQPRPF